MKTRTRTRFAALLSLLAVATVPASAATPQAAPASTTAAPADRTALEKEFAQLQQRMDKLAERMGKLSSQLSLDSPRMSLYRYVSDPDRGTIGLVLGLNRNRHGLEVEAVTPDGPADQAGIRAGDVIVGVNGNPVTDNSRLPEALTQIGTGSTVRLGVLRNGKRRVVTVKAEHHAVPGWIAALANATSSPSVISLRKEIGQWKNDPSTQQWLSGFHDLASKLSLAFDHQLAPWWGLNLIALNPDLASYFGTRQGALVLSTQPDHYPGLKAGDVITAVNGEPVDNPEDVMRALRGKPADQPARLKVLRHGKSRTMEVRPRHRLPKPRQPSLSSLMQSRSL